MSTTKSIAEIKRELATASSKSCRGLFAAKCKREKSDKVRVLASELTNAEAVERDKLSQIKKNKLESVDYGSIASTGLSVDDIKALRGGQNTPMIIGAAVIVVIAIALLMMSVMKKRPRSRGYTSY